MKQNVKILFLGDIVGRPGRKAVTRFLAQNGENYDFVIANVENASHGFGLTERNYNELSEAGIDAMTSGNHIWDKKDIFNYIDSADKLLRPLNYPKDTPGIGSKIFQRDGYSIAVINLLGTVFMPPVDLPWEFLQSEVERLKKETGIIIVDFHAEATAEKVTCGHIADSMGVSALIGTHTHIQTSDEKVLENGTAYLTDAGFNGAYKSAIGMNLNDSIRRMVKIMPARMEVADDKLVQINGVELEIELNSGRVQRIERINFVKNFDEEVN